MHERPTRVRYLLWVPYIAVEINQSKYDSERAPHPHSLARDLSDLVVTAVSQKEGVCIVTDWCQGGDEGSHPYVFYPDAARKPPTPAAIEAPIAP